MLNKLTRQVQPRAKSTLHEIIKALDRESALEEITSFSKKYGAHYPKAIETLTKDQDRLLTFFDFPVEHWIDLRTTDLTESPFATIKARTRKCKGTGSRKAGLAMAFKLLLSVEKRWRRLNTPHIVAPVRASVKFPNDQAEMLQVDTSGDHFLAEIPSIYAATEV